MIERCIVSQPRQAVIRIALLATRERLMIEGVLVDNIVFEKMERSSRIFSPLEAGGLMLGYRKEGFLHAIDVTVPGAWDRHSRSAFHRSVKAHRFRAIRLWRKSGGVVDWLGEWHSHPALPLNPSGTDHRNWSRITKHRKAPMLFPIVDGQKAELYLKLSYRTVPCRLTATDQDDNSRYFSVVN